MQLSLDSAAACRPMQIFRPRLQGDMTMGTNPLDLIHIEVSSTGCRSYKVVFRFSLLLCCCGLSALITNWLPDLKPTAGDSGEDTRFKNAAWRLANRRHCPSVPVRPCQLTAVEQSCGNLTDLLFSQARYRGAAGN